MDLILLIGLFVYLAVGSKEGSSYHEIEQLDELYGKVSKPQSEPQQNKQEQPTDIPNKPPIEPSAKPPLEPLSKQGAPMGMSKPPQPMPDMGMGIPKPPPPPPNGSGVKAGIGMPIPPPAQNNQKKSTTVMGFDFSSFDDVMSSKIDNSAFTELEKNR